MPVEPLVSIVVPVLNGEATVALALASALAQTLREVEVVCVDDASTDSSVTIVEAMQVGEPRLRLVRHDSTQSAVQARRSGVDAAAGSYILFLDSDDTLEPDAAEKTLAAAEAGAADLVGFGVTVIGDNLPRHAGERRPQPNHPDLESYTVIEGLLPDARPAPAEPWRYLFRTCILREAYAMLPRDLRLSRSTGLPVVFLVAALATRFVSIDDKLYRHHLDRDWSRRYVDAPAQIDSHLQAIDAIDSIVGAVESLTQVASSPPCLPELYDSARLSIIAQVCQHLIEHTAAPFLDQALDAIYMRVAPRDVIRAAARFSSSHIIEALKDHGASVKPSADRVRKILLVTGTMATGGISAVVASQARILHDAGFLVTIVAKVAGAASVELPDGVLFVEMTSHGPSLRLAEWALIIDEHNPDAVIDHHVLYGRDWADFALLSRAAGVPTVGWIHNFAARPLYDGNNQLSRLERHLSVLQSVIVLSPLDVAYWKLRGIRNVAYIPNPPSPLLLDARRTLIDKSPPVTHIELVWWGRLEQRTKNVLGLLDVAESLKRASVPFRLTIIGPDWTGMSARRLNSEARRRSLRDHVRAVGPLHGHALVAAIDAAHVLINTSVIEGYPLTLLEAQSRGLPVIMYELPWLAITQNNAGIVAVPQGDPAAAAAALRRIFKEPEYYRVLSLGSVDAANEARAHDFAMLYRQVLSDSLPRMFSPEPTLDDARRLLGHMVSFAERASTAQVKGAPVHATPSRKLGRAGRVALIAVRPIGRAVLKRFPQLHLRVHRLKKRLGSA
ncbi:glycosyltransferase [Microbacterium caowuchunii]|uniref:glycosyltransferase n=1 Tax=Microbacterium caowuchunii TaxID=2614638 RepID=UPI001784CBD0|nr:glycosyltransferase [Microbacterium caowuchunii]